MRAVRATLLSAAIAACTALLPAAAQQQLRQVTVSQSRRTMAEIGVQQTAFDSTALRQSIAASMADVLTFHSSVFVKSHGRASLSTVAFRGTSPGHTQVTWNGMRINSPMLGTTDFSTLPAYFIDRASLLHGSSSVTETGGGLGGLVKLQSAPLTEAEGVHGQYVQGVGSFKTFDEFARLSWGNDHWQVSTRAAMSSSANDYPFTNHDKKENVYGPDHSIVAQYHPRERNRSGAFRDLNVMQQVHYSTLRGDRLGLSVWLTRSNRELPLLTTDYGTTAAFDNRQRETTLRAVASWHHSRPGWHTELRAGYAHTRLNYDYSREVSPGHMAAMTRARSRIHTIFGQAEGTWTPHPHWQLSLRADLHQQMVRSADRNVIKTDGGRAVVGYDKARPELSAAVSMRWQPGERAGLGAVIRQEWTGGRGYALIPALMGDVTLSRRGNVMLRASASRNYHTPTLNDLYFLPGGNPSLASERGLSWDCGISASHSTGVLERLSGSVNWFDSYIDNWIIWLPTGRGFFSPRNVKKVHAYGIEASAGLTLSPGRGWQLSLDGSLSWTPSVNRGTPMSEADESVGKQLPYVPRHSASVTGRLSWRGWSLCYNWAYYSERFTMSSNDYSLTGRLPDYFMSNVTVEKRLSLGRRVELQLKLAVNNLLNEDYLSVLARPMPGINLEGFAGISF